MIRLIIYIVLLTSSLLICSCGNREVSYTEVEYDKATETFLYEGKPYTGKILADEDHSNEYAIVKDGKLIDIVKTRESSNGYKEIRHKDGSSEYYDYNGNRISKSEYEKER